MTVQHTFTYFALAVGVPIFELETLWNQ